MRFRLLFASLLTSLLISGAAPRDVAAWPAPLGDWSEIALRLSESDRLLEAGLSKEALIERLVQVQAAPALSAGASPPLPETFVADVKAALLAYPRCFLSFLLKNNVKILIAPFVTAADASLNNLHPRGYKDGLTFAECRAVFVPKSGNVIVASHYFRDGKLLENKYPTFGVQHELCHAVDFYLGRPSLTVAFRARYRQDKELVSVVDNTYLRYYLQEGEGGPIETFGQLLVYKYTHVRERRTLALVRCFPDCVQQIDRFFPAN